MIRGYQVSAQIEQIEQIEQIMDGYMNGHKLLGLHR